MKEPTRFSSPNLLFPPFLAELVLGIARANEAGFPIAIFESFRSPLRQGQLFEQGRSQPGKIITNAKPWASWHQYGLAADIALFQNGGWSWDFDPKKISKFFESPKLTWGGTFKNFDGPHYEWKKKPSLVVSEALVKSQGILRFWAEIEASS
jgi:hypothetical protein